MKLLREKLLATLESTQTVNRRLLVFVFLFVVVVAAILISLNSAKPYQSDTGASSASADQAPLDDSAQSETSLSLQQPTFFVHVVGEVVNPGIYVIESNSRLFDAIFAAGGFTKSADQSSVNLAREVSDGEQVIVMPIGAANAQMPASESSFGRAEPLVSINRASQVELESLPGVGPTLAGRMIDWRAANGGFKKKEDLLKVTGIGQKLFASMKDKLTL